MCHVKGEKTRHPRQTWIERQKMLMKLSMIKRKSLKDMKIW